LGLDFALSHYTHLYPHRGRWQGWAAYEFAEADLGAALRTQRLVDLAETLGPRSLLCSLSLLPFKAKPLA